MGRYYALADGEHPEVADAIAEHYSPLGPDDACPTAPVAVAVALADKIDTLAGFFRIDEKPTGSKDPFALRRAALGVIRLIVENQVRLPLRQVVEWANKLVSQSMMRAVREAAKQAGGSQVLAEATVLRTVPGWGEIDTDVLAVLDFFADRLKVALREKGVRHDLIAAVFALGGEDDLVRLLARVEALGAFLKTDDGANLLVAFRRANNIVRIEEEKHNEQYEGDDVQQSLLKEEAEKKLFGALNRVLEQVVQARDEECYEDACRAFATLRAPVDRFFDTVRVNVDDTQMRENRLRLLDKIRSRFFMLADFSKIEG
jgi:glycyl-tRNA synthetase beta chain